MAIYKFKCKNIYECMWAMYWYVGSCWCREKREKYKVFLSKSITKNFQDKIREVIFPYADEDIPKLNGSAFIILKFENM